MAKKENHRFDDDLNFDFDEGDFGADPFNPAKSEKADRNPVTKAGGSLLRGAKDETKNLSFYKGIMKAAMPESFTTTLDSVDDVLDLSNRSYQQAMREARPMMSQVRRIAGSLNRTIPSPFQSKIDNYLKSKDKKGLEDVQVDMEEASVAQGVGDIFAEREEDDRRVEQAEKLVEFVNQRDYRKNVLTQLANINRQLTIQTENSLRVQRAWQHKSLEVSLRQLFVQRRTLEITQKGMEENSMLLRDIVKNTALPDIQKEQQSETMTRLTRERIYGAAQSRVSDWARSNKYLRNVAQRFNNALKQRMQSFQMGLQAGADMFESVEEQMKAAKEFGIDTTQMAGEMAGGSLANKAGQWVGKNVGKRLRLDRADNFFRSVNFRKDMAGHYLSRYGKQLKRGNNRFGQWAGDILDVPFQADTTVATGRLADMDLRAGKMNIEDRKLQALEVTLPGFLSRLLQEVSAIRTGTMSDRIVFDPQKGNFTTMRESTQGLAQRVLSDDSINNAQSSLNDLIDRVGGKGITRAQRNELGKFLRNKSKDQTWGFTPEALLDPSNGLSPSLRNRLVGNLSARYGLVEDKTTGRWKAPLGGMKGIGQLERDARSFGSFRDYAADAYTNIKSIHSLGGIEQLLEMGAVYWDDNQQTYELNPDYVENRSNAKFRQQNLRNKSVLSPDRSDLTNFARSRGIVSGGVQSGPRATGAAFGGGEDSEQETGLKRMMGRSKETGIARAIRDQTEALLNAYDNMPIREVQEEQADILADILDKLHAGVDTNATGMLQKGPGLLLRAGRAAKAGVKAWWKIGGLPFKAANWARKKLARPSSWIGGKAWNALKGIKGAIFDRGAKMVSDVYVQGQDGLRRALESAWIKLGKYTDVKTGKVIKSIKDITGPVINNETGEIVLTQEDFDKGLLNSVGERIKTGALGVAKSLLKGLGRFVISPVTKPLAMARAGLNAVRKMIMTPPDVYLRGQMDKPVLYGQQMFNGMYWSNTTNKVVRYIGDIDGDIYTWDREAQQKRIVLTAQQIADPGLVDVNGKPLVGFMKKWKDRIKGGINFITKNINPMTWLRRGKNAVGKAWNGVKSVAGSLSGGLHIGGGSWNKRIYTLLWNKFNGLPLDAGLTGGTGGAVGGFFRKTGEWARDKAKNLLGFGGEKWKALASLFGGINVRAIPTKLRRAFGFGKANLKDRLDAEKDREGSWVNRLAAAGTAVKSRLPKRDEITGKFPWMKLVMGGFGLVTGALTTIRKVFSSFGSKILGWIPKLIKVIGNTRLGASAMDLAGSLLGRKGRVGRTIGKAVKGLGRGIGTLVKSPGKALWGATKLAGRGALGVARLATSGVGLALRAVPMLFTPVGLAAVAAAGLGYLIYKGFKAYSGRITSVREMRLAQYGFAKQDDSDKLGRVLALEEACLKSVKWDSMGVPQLGKLDYDELMNAFEISPTAEKSRRNWAIWFVKRFRPVFLHNLKVIRDKDPKGDITDPYAGLPKGKIPDYAIASRLPDKDPSGQPGPYFVDAAPFPNMSAAIGPALVDATINKVVAEFKKDAKKFKTEERKADGMANVKNEAFGAKGGNKMAPGMQFEAGKDRMFDSSEASKAIGNITGDVDTDRKIVAGNIIDNVTSVRMRLYGMMQLKRSQVDLLMKFEKDLIDRNIAIRNKVAEFTGDIGDIANSWAPAFGITLTDESAMADWRMWFSKRFMPVFLNFCTRGDKWVGLKDLVSKVRTAHPERQYSIAEFMSIATTEINGVKKSIWVVSSYPFPEESANTDSLIIKPIMDAMRLAIKEQAYKDQAQKDKASGKGESLAGQKARRELAGYAKANPDAARASVFGEGAGNTAIAKTSYTNEEMSGGFSSNIGEGNGGTAAGIPQVDAGAIQTMKSMDARAKALMPVFEAVSSLTGVDVATLMAFVQKESSFQPYAKAPTSSASGLMQFIDSTWESYVPKLKALGFASPDKFDPAASIAAGALYIKDNAKMISKVTGKPPTLGELYLAHFMGGGGAQKILSMDPGEDWARGMEAAAKANASIHKANPTAGALRAWAASSMEKNLDTPRRLGVSIGTSAISPSSGTFTTNTTGPVETGSAPITPSVDGAPSSGGSAPITPAEALRSPVTPSDTSSGSSNPFPVFTADAGISRQAKRQYTESVEEAHSERVVAQTNQARNRYEAESMEKTRADSNVRERIAVATESTADTIKKIHEYLTGKGSGGGNPPSNNQIKEDMLIKNASSSVSVGQKSGALPFSTSN
ncbi:transglycosylase SLT domain-containing protein [Escherichia coli]|nr:transglycosylase SLT domain-containing protein [Escherichia coli]